MTSQQKLHRFENQVSPNLGPAYNLARWLTRNHEDAEDLVQEAFLRAFSAFDTLRGENAKPWLLAIVRNTYLSSMRRRWKSNTVELKEQGENQPREPSPDPEETLLISCDCDQVRNALEQLPSDFREAVVLREIEGLSYKEIAVAIGVPLGTVMSRLSRGRDWLRRILSSPQPAARGEGAGLR